MTNPKMNENDHAAVRILRRLYEATDMEGGDTLFSARQYLQDRERYIQNYSGAA